MALCGPRWRQMSPRHRDEIILLIIAVLGLALLLWLGTLAFGPGGDGALNGS